jgi:alkylation response protein AidB-like acyl-CoA dehydrogenase
MVRRACLLALLAVVALVLSGLVTPALALGRQPNSKLKLTPTPASVFPDRTYLLQLPRHAAMPKLFLTENASPVLNLAISAAGGGASGTYVIRYRSLLPPQVKAVVGATITGFPAATATYTTPALNVSESESLERRWMDSQYVTILVTVAVVALMAFALLTRRKLRD